MLWLTLMGLWVVSCVVWLVSIFTGPAWLNDVMLPLNILFIAVFQLSVFIRERRERHNNAHGGANAGV